MFGKEDGAEFAEFDNDVGGAFIEKDLAGDDEVGGFAEIAGLGLVDDEEVDAADMESARDAIRSARSSRASPTSGKRRRVLPHESIGMRAYGMKLEYQQSLEAELKEIEGENARLERELEDGWGEWRGIVEEVKAALEVMEKLGEGNDYCEGAVVRK